MKLNIWWPTYGNTTMAPAHLILAYPAPHLQLISTLKIGADCCQLCQYKLTKPNITYYNPEE